MDKIIEKKVLSLLSLAAKAGKVNSGEFMTEKTLQMGDACLVIIADDASANTKKKFSNKATYYGVPYRVVFDSTTLGKMIGRQRRATAAVIDKGFAEQIIKKLDCQ